MASNKRKCKKKCKVDEEEGHIGQMSHESQKNKNYHMTYLTKSSSITRG